VSAARKLWASAKLCTEPLNIDNIISYDFNNSARNGYFVASDILEVFIVSDFSKLKKNRRYPQTQTHKHTRTSHTQYTHNTRTHTHTLTHARTHARTQTYTYSHTKHTQHTLARSHTHTHTHTQHPHALFAIPNKKIYAKNLKIKGHYSI
jgi:hypothetical protein